MKKIKTGEIIKYKNIWLKAIKHNSCDECYFKLKDCFKISKELDCNAFTDYAISFKELSEIEVLVLLGDKNENTN